MKSVADFYFSFINVSIADVGYLSLLLGIACCFDLSVADIMDKNFNANVVKEFCAEAKSDDDVAAVALLMELTFIRDGIFLLPGLSKDNVNDLIGYICQI